VLFEQPHRPRSMLVNLLLQGFFECRHGYLLLPGARLQGTDPVPEPPRCGVRFSVPMV